MKVLITSARMPFALDMIRKLSAAGHEVHAADDLADAAGSHSKYLSGHVVTASPRADTESFIADVERFCADRGIEVVVPAFEEAFYLATQRERLERTAKLYLAPFATLARLHDKVAFQRLAEGLDLPIPPCVVATSDDELREAIERWPRYFARAAFSRGGVALLTNTGPLAGELRREPPDLTRFSERNGGVFPSQRVYRIIDGRDVAAHGDRTMPVWGDAFKSAYGGSGESAIQERIDALVKHLESLQVKASN